MLKLPWMMDLVVLSLHMAAMPEVGFAVFESLLDTMPHIEDCLGNDPFHYLVSTEDDVSIAKMQLLIASGRSFDDVNNDGFTPLALAVGHKNRQATETLLSAGSNPYTAAHQGQTLLHLAACVGNIEAVELLLEVGLVRQTKDDSGMTAEELAVSYGHDPVATIIRNAVDGDHVRNVTNVTTLDDKRLSGISNFPDPHGKLPLRVHRQYGYPATTVNCASAIAQGSTIRNSPDVIEKLNVASLETLHSEVQQKASLQPTNSNSAPSDCCPQHADT